MHQKNFPSGFYWKLCNSVSNPVTALWGLSYFAALGTSREKRKCQECHKLSAIRYLLWIRRILSPPPHFDRLSDLHLYITRPEYRHCLWLCLLIESCLDGRNPLEQRAGQKKQVPACLLTHSVSSVRMAQHVISINIPPRFGCLVRGPASEPQLETKHWAWPDIYISFGPPRSSQHHCFCYAMPRKRVYRK